MAETTNQIVFWSVVLGRFLLPLGMPRFPLPAIIASLLLDAVDQTIFQTFTTLDLSGYQSYDKALDVYYLAIAYVSTLRNWRNQFALKIGRLLWYYRLLGVTLFELLHWRGLLLIFPNTFEYFFIFYHLFALRWQPKRLTRRNLLLAAAAIWIFIKLPQETWIHILQIDTTDFLKTAVLGAPPEMPWAGVLAANLWLLPLTALLLAGLAYLVRWLLQKLPPPNRPFALDTGPYAQQPAVQRIKRPARFFNIVLLEKIALVALVSLIFAQIMPNMVLTNLQLALAVAFIIVLNTLISHSLPQRGARWRSGLQAFAVMLTVNVVLATLYSLLLPAPISALNRDNMLFFSLLLTLIVILFDRYHAVYRARHAPDVG